MTLSEIDYQSADTLGDGGGDGCRADAEAKPGHKEHIQRNVDAGGENQIVERMLAVTHGVEDAHKNVVHHREDSAAEVVAEIGD